MWGNGGELILCEDFKSTLAIENWAPPVEITVNARTQLAPHARNGMEGVCGGRAVGDELVARGTHEVGTIRGALETVSSRGSTLPVKESE